MINENKLDTAKSLYKRVIEEYPEAKSEAAEATWQLATIAEEQSDWLNAVLLYESIYIDYPGSPQGFEAPLRVANHYNESGEAAAANAAYGKAITHYNELISKYVDTSIKVTAENYIIRALTEQKQWSEAVERLLALPDRYPAYSRLRGNYLLAASIYEEELGDNAEAADVLRRCIEKYPKTALAEEAEKQLQRLEGQK
jgi:TolA-binding protein